jgi:hypothetical protein
MARALSASEPMSPLRVECTLGWRPLAFRSKHSANAAAVSALERRSGGGEVAPPPVDEALRVVRPITTASGEPPVAERRTAHNPRAIIVLRRSRYRWTAPAPSDGSVAARRPLTIVATILSLAGTERRFGIPHSPAHIKRV